MKKNVLLRPTALILALVLLFCAVLSGIYLFELQFCLDICPGVGLLDHFIILFLVL